MICPHCNRQINDNPTIEQLKAYTIVYILGKTQAVAAKLMGVTPQRVHSHLKKLAAKFPDMFPRKTTPPNFVSYDESMAYAVKQKW